MIIDEASKIPQRTWEQYLRPTLADRKGWAAFVSTPEGFGNHFHDLYQRGQDTSYKEWESWQFPSWESPYFKDDIEELKKRLRKKLLSKNSVDRLSRMPEKSTVTSPEKVMYGQTSNTTQSYHCGQVWTSVIASQAWDITRSTPSTDKKSYISLTKSVTKQK